MGRKQYDQESSRMPLLVLVLLASVSCVVVYTSLSEFFNKKHSTVSFVETSAYKRSDDNGCCRGVEHLEIWGAAVKWGTEFKFNSSVLCCESCKAMCKGNDGPCLCDTWVFCGSKEACGSRFGECWLKKQKDTMSPDLRESGSAVIWTSGLIFAKGEDFVGLATKHGTLRIKLFPDCAPHSVAYILELLSLRHCAGCQFYRAESRGHHWDLNGNHIKNADFGPPFAMIQGTLEVQGTTFNNVPAEDRPSIIRGSVAWAGGSGPEFFISLANHKEWHKQYTVFGSVLPEDMEIVEKIANLPTKSDIWSGINVSVLTEPLPLQITRINKQVKPK